MSGITATAASMAMQQQHTGMLLRVRAVPPSESSSLSVLRSSVVAAGSVPAAAAAAASHSAAPFEARAGSSSSSLECALQCDLTGSRGACAALASVSNSARSQLWSRDLRGAHRISPSVRSCSERRAFLDGDFEETDSTAPPRSTRNLLSEVGYEDLSFLERLALVWSIFFHSSKRKTSTNAEIAKQRLKMILVSDRCSVNDEAKKRIVNNIVGSLADFVEIEAEDKVQLSISSDPSVGTVYSVTVPVRRVKPEYQSYSRGLQNAALEEDFGEEFRTLDIKIEYPENAWSNYAQN